MPPQFKSGYDLVLVEMTGKAFLRVCKFLFNLSWAHDGSQVEAGSHKDNAMSLPLVIT